MSFELDALLNIPGVTVEMCSYQDQEVYLTGSPGFRVIIFSN
jgi:hypothetical protein